MSNHFTGLSLGPPMGDQRLDLCDLYAFQSPADPNKTVIILNANPNADALFQVTIFLHILLHTRKRDGIARIFPARPIKSSRDGWLLFPNPLHGLSFKPKPARTPVRQIAVGSKPER